MNKIEGFFRKYWITFLIIALMVGAYVFVTSNKLANPFFFPPAKDIVHALWEFRYRMLKNMVASFKLIIPAICISAAIALAVGTLVGMNSRLRDALHPIIYTFSVIPAIMLSPFVLLLAPTITAAAIFLIVYGTVWATMFATITGVMTVDKRYLEKARTLELTGFKRFVKVILPAASPAIFAGFTNSMRSSFVMLVFAEMSGVQKGMGFFVKKYSTSGVFANTWAGFIFMAAVLVIVMLIFERVKRHILRWTMN
ncbi:MAG: ABC transporter permease subunit [Lachnospiraceae bacterium]|nr:ABC transporter permease subunit [Lachnospiraceae bacterium]